MGDAVKTADKTTYPVAGTAVDGSGITKMVWYHRQYACYSAGNAKRGPELISDGSGGKTTGCLNNGHYAGMHPCRWGFIFFFRFVRTLAHTMCVMRCVAVAVAGPNVCYCANGVGAYEGDDHTGMLYLWVKPFSCSDGVLSGDETDVDCGGSCEACGDGASCLADSDCANGFCAGSCVVDTSGYAFYGTGVGEVVTVPSGVDLTSGEDSVTFEAWVMARTPEALGQVVLDAASSGNIRVTVGLEEGTGRALYQVDNRGAGDATGYVTSVDAVPASRWVHVAFVATGGRTTAYLDGRPAGVHVAPQPAVGVRAQVSVGRGLQHSSLSFAGALDDVRVWTVAVPHASIGADMGARAGAVLAYSFNSASKSDLPRTGGTVRDDSPSGSTGSLDCGDTNAGCVAPAVRSRARCSDGFRQGLEKCDDGNSVPGDGCSASCVVEEGFVCGPPSGGSLGADVCVAAAAQLQETFEGDSEVAWSAVQGGGTLSVRAAGHARVGTSGLYATAGVSQSMTYTSTVLATDATDTSQVSFLLSVPAVAQAVPMAMTLIAASQGSVQPLQCVSDADCGGKPSVTLCFNAHIPPAGCDENIVLDGSADGVWHSVAFSIAEKFRAKYGASTAWDKGLQVIVGVAGGAAATWFRMDELRVFAPSPPVVAAHAGEVGGGHHVDAGWFGAAERCPDVTAISSTAGDGSVGSTPALSKASCLRILEANPLARSGMYYVHLGHGPTSSKVTLVYCDMDTDGGGFTMWWRGIGGWPPGGNGRSNAALWSSGENTPILPGTYHSRSAYHTDVYNYFREQTGVHLVKQMKLYYHPTASMSSQQAVRLELGATTLKHLTETSEVVNNKCQTLPSRVRFYSTQRDSGTDKTVDMGDTTYFMGETDRLMVYGANYGFANSQHDGADECGQSTANLVNDTTHFRRLDCHTMHCRMNTIRHLWSYAHTSVDKSSSRCMFACWGTQSDYHEVFTWGAREALGGDMYKGDLVSNNFDAIMAGCPVANSRPFVVQSAADFARWKLWVATQAGNDAFFANAFANNADVGYIAPDKTYHSASIPSGDRSAVSGNGNSGCGGSAAYPNYDPLPIDRNGINTLSGGTYLYITCEASRTAYVTCVNEAAVGKDGGGELITGALADNNDASIFDNKCPSGSSLFSVLSNDDFVRLNNWAKAQPGGTNFYANVFADNTDIGALVHGSYASAGVTDSAKSTVSGNGNSGCGGAAGYSNYDPVPFQAGVGILTRTSGTHLHIHCEEAQQAYVVCETTGSGANGAAILVDGTDVLEGSGYTLAGAAAGELHLARVPNDGSAPATLSVDLSSGASDPTTAVATFIDAAAADDVVAGALVPDPVGSTELAMPVALIPVLSQLGVGAPSLAHAALAGWAFVGRKGSSLGDVPAATAFDVSTHSVASTAFLCGSRSLTLASNAPGGVRIALHRRPGHGGAIPLNSGGTVQFDAVTESGAQVFGVGGGAMSAPTLGTGATLTVCFYGCCTRPCRMV